MTSRDRIERRRIVENSKWTVYLDHLRDARGNSVPDYLIVEPIEATPTGITGVSVLPVLNGRFVLIRTYRYATGTSLWEAPRGFVEAAEHPATAALRELFEETGLTCNTGDLVKLGCYTPEASTLAARVALFLAPRCSGSLRIARDEIGIEAMAAHAPEDMAELVKQGLIEDAGTLIAYYQSLALIQP